MKEQAMWVKCAVGVGLVLGLTASHVQAGYSSWRGGVYYHDTYNNLFNIPNNYWAGSGGNTDTTQEHFIFGAEGEHSLAGKWVNLSLTDDVRVFALRALGGGSDGSYTVNMDLNGHNFISEVTNPIYITWDGGLGADPGVAMNLTNSSAIPSVFTWNALYIGHESNTVGTVNVRGPNLALKVAQGSAAPCVGLSGRGTLNVSGGAVFSTVEAFVLSPLAGASGFVNVSASVVTSSTIYAWTAGNGAITVENGGHWHTIGHCLLGVNGQSGNGEVLVTGPGSVFSVQLWFQISGTKLTIADGGHVEVQDLRPDNTSHIVYPTGILRFDNGTFRCPGRLILWGGSEFQFVLKNARETPFIEITHEGLWIDPTVRAKFEMDRKPDLLVNDFIPLVYSQSWAGTFEGYPEGHEFSVPYHQTEYQFRINYQLGSGSTIIMGLTVLKVPSGESVMLIR